MNCLGCVPSRQLNVISYLIVIQFSLVVVFVVVVFPSVSIFLSFFPPGNEMCRFTESMHILLRFTKSIWPFVFKEWITLSICPLDAYKFGNTYLINSDLTVG